jgi:acyl carrier protein
MSKDIQIGEAEFMERARIYIRDSLGKGGEEIDPDADLIRTGIFDSLLLISFLSFIERLRGQELSEIPDLSGAFTLRSAYSLATR